MWTQSLLTVAPRHSYLVRECVRACVCACMRACVCVFIHNTSTAVEPECTTTPSVCSLAHAITTGNIHLELTDKQPLIHGASSRLNIGNNWVYVTSECYYKKVVHFCQLHNLLVSHTRLTVATTDRTEQNEICIYGIIFTSTWPCDHAVLVGFATSPWYLALLSAVFCLLDPQFTHR